MEIQFIDEQTLGKLKTSVSKLSRTLLDNPLAFRQAAIDFTMETFQDGDIMRMAIQAARKRGKTNSQITGLLMYELDTPAAIETRLSAVEKLLLSAGATLDSEGKLAPGPQPKQRV